MDRANEIRRLEKKVAMTRVSGILFVIALAVGTKLNIPLNILATIIVIAAIALVLFVGIPTQRKLFALRKEIANEEGKENDEDRTIGDNKGVAKSKRDD